MNIVIGKDIFIKLLDKEDDNVFGLLKEISELVSLWFYAGSLSDINRIIKKKSVISPNESVYIINSLVEEFNIQWLAALGSDCIFNKNDDTDLEVLQFNQAVKRLGSKTYVLSDDVKLNKYFDNAINTEELENLHIPEKKIDFIDLKAQQKKIRQKLERRIFQVLDHGQYIGGNEILELEKKLSDFVRVKHSIAVSSGTDSLLIAMMALDIEPDMEVITVPYTWISTAEMISLRNVKPVFVDIDPKTYNLDPKKLESAITKKTKAIMPVSIFGQCADMDIINDIANRYNIPVIEDAAQSFGATYKGKKSCNLSTIGSTSFFPAKPLGCYGDGGAVFTNDDELADVMRQIRNHGQKEKHYHPLIGLNARFDTLQAAITIPKLEIFDKECEMRKEAGNYYSEHLGKYSNIVTPYIEEFNSSVYAQYTIQVDDRDDLQSYLSKYNIPSVSYYILPLHLQACFKNLNYKSGDFPVTENLSNKCLSLPMSPYIKRSQQDFIIEKISKWLGSRQ